MRGFADFYQRFFGETQPLRNEPQELEARSPRATELRGVVEREDAPIFTSADAGKVERAFISVTACAGRKKDPVRGGVMIRWGGAALMAGGCPEAEGGVQKSKGGSRI